MGNLNRREWNKLMLGSVAATVLPLENLVAAVDADNLPSIQIHKKFGFVETGRMPNVARKFSRNLTLSLLQLQIKKS